eukprot:TRINITY_DN1265_c0_g1_i1.p1 TRINITY_DN1265_c0_g1~~TRINITY_DN1265_c0_g1_i1.p1  ORF type:complete len:685 (-),score=197.48 TRINITY_DN1265_c0_g1_i1:62-2116(-)
MPSRHVALAALVAGAGAVTPVEKVVQLLTKLSGQVEEEGKTEAAQYDKYACFCKEQADGKLYAIEKSTKKIGVLEAKIQELTGEIDSLGISIGELSTSITQLAGDIKTKNDVRKGEHDTFLASQADMAGAISACERALAELKESKGAMSGKVALEALAQLREQVARHKMSADLLLAVGKPGEAYQYEYHANDIISVIENLQTKFIGLKNDLEQTEFEANSIHEKNVLAMTNEKTFKEDEKAQKEALVEAKTEERSTATQDQTDETAAKKADQSFLDVVTEECQTKANLFDQRSKTRSAELTAISEALETLKTGVKPNWGANRKLVDIQTVAKAPVAAAVKRHAPSSFLQLRGARNAEGHIVMQKALALLSDAATRLHSPILSAVALKARVSEDHFVKVRQLIKDLVAKLEADKMNEATQKSECDTQMKSAIERRDAAKAALEDLESQISGKTAEESQLTVDVATLSAEIAKNAKELNEATLLRGEEKATNDKTVADAGVGKEAVEMALSILSKFYEESGVFVQTGAAYVPPNSDREGKTVADLAPEVFDENYKGKQKESKGIIGLLEVILADFDRTKTTVSTEETNAALDFDEYKSDLETDTSTKEKEKGNKENTLKDTKDTLVTLKDNRKDQQALLDTAESELSTLKSMCVDGEETYEQRVAARAKEIEALKEALQILDNWKA